MTEGKIELKKFNSHRASWSYKWVREENVALFLNEGWRRA